MHRRNFLALSTAAAAAPGFAFQVEKSRMKVTSVRLVQTRPKHPLPAYKPSPDAWSTGGVEVASPMSIYPQYKSMRSLFMPDPGKVPGFTPDVIDKVKPELAFNGDPYVPPPKPEKKKRG